MYVTKMILVKWVLVSAGSSDMPTISWPIHGPYGDGKPLKKRVVRHAERINHPIMLVFLPVDSTEATEST